MSHPAFTSSSIAIVTGGAAGIGLAIARKLAGFGMSVTIADLGEDRLEKAAASIRECGAAKVLAVETDVADLAAVCSLQAQIETELGTPNILFANAGIQPGSTVLGGPDTWRRILGVNLWGIINTCQTFAPAMIAEGKTGLIVNTGSKQGITTPPGDPAYNVSKSGVKTFTEALAHELRNTPDCSISAHLLIPGFVYTDLTKRDRSEKPDAAWTPEQTADFAFDSLEKGNFYILCPDNDVPRTLDEKRIIWAANDIVENRPALSRWHPDHADAFAAWLKSK